jgi:hypothetical protein
MKKYLINIGASVFLLFLMLTWNGCDEFNSLPLNIPLTIKLDLTTSGGSLSASQEGCLSTNSDTYNEYKDKINSLRFVEAAFRTINVDPGELSGDITVTLSDENGTELFSYSAAGTRLADYMKPNSPYIFKLTQEQIDFINTYLDDIVNGTGGSCFTATVTVNNLHNGGQINTLNCAIDMVIEADMQF